MDAVGFATGCKIRNRGLVRSAAHDRYWPEAELRR